MATRKIVMAFNPYRFQSRLVESFKQLLQTYAGESVTERERHRNER